MSVARPTRSLLGKYISSAAAQSRSPASTVVCRQFHSSAPYQKKRRSQFRNVKAEELGLLKPDAMEKYQKEHLPDYTPEELELLRQKYTPEQMEALEAAEQAVNPGDIAIQGRLRDDLFRPKYIEDFTVMDPRYDLKSDLKGTLREHKWDDNDERFEEEFLDKFSKVMEKGTTNQLTRAMIRALRRVKTSQGQDLIDLTEAELSDMEKDPSLLEKYLVKPDEREPKYKEKETESDDFITRAQALKLDEMVETAWKKELDLLSHSKHTELKPSTFELEEDGPTGPIRLHTAEAVELGKVPGVAGLYKTSADEDDGKDDMGQYTELKQLTGLTLSELKSIYNKTLVIRHVHNQTRLGKIRSVSAMVIAGNGNGRLGLGVGKSTQMDVAVNTATMLAIRNMKPLRRYENRTIYGNITSKVSGTVVELSARPPGFGLRVPSRLFEMCRAAGLHDLAVHMPRSKNPMNTVKATYNALMNQPDPEEIAIGRGKKLVDARKVYYGGAVL
ncbi:unnamed protein product [Clonostachys byssicola]|uniref:Small ribosomal subunit protein uS5m n=1 Tax=Clonostachys byssicola TaxID=160290 RepID=A0A9N9YCF8_9HYPO|nr:unnamed protein product [Clonostachys byssicola]